MVFLLVRPFSAKRVLGDCFQGTLGKRQLRDNGNHKATAQGNGRGSGWALILSLQHQGKEAEIS